MIMEIARREFAVRARTKSWRVVTGLLVALTIGLIVLVSVLDDGEDDDRREVTVALTSDVPADLEQMVVDPARSRFDVTVVEATDDAEADLADADVVVDGDTLVWREEVDFELSFFLQQALAELAALERGRDLGLDGGEVASLLAPVDIA